MQKITLKGVEVDVAFRMDSERVKNKVMLFLSPKMASAFSKLLDKEINQMCSLRGYIPNRPDYIPFQRLEDGRARIAIRSTDQNCTYGYGRAKTLCGKRVDIVMYMDAYAIPTNQGVRFRLEEMTEHIEEAAHDC